MAKNASNDYEGDSESDLEPYSQEYLDGLLEKAASVLETKTNGQRTEEEVILLQQDDADSKPLPSLDAKRLLPKPYFSQPEDRNSIPLLSQDSVIESVATSSTPSLPPPPMLDKQGHPLTKRQINELKKKQAKPGYFELPTPDEAELLKIQREAEAVRLRNAVDPKKFYRKEAAINVKKMSKQIAIGTILPTTTPFGTASTDNLTRAERKRTIVEELVEDSEARRYAKRKFEELQSVHGERGRDTWNRKKIARKPKW
ncbi:hypothetical protein M408DRAFT_152151 [Serendipita vermifera MAFF 305830]|uniref:Fcf2 pre-rRNA processing C-terminal domain-containing protein n=1 Tax=Serendipita vermifera MAFF 305830 TaxID=933852 RepID=A0A0C2XWM7_SERVB|nr:hypothetical protein M408DRAFT_152151 [Serendipita vermifera MAFF 305830]